MPFHSSVSASKGAIEGLTRSLAAEFAPKIRVNAIAPSILDTPMAEKFLNSDSKKDNAKNRHPMKEIGSAQDISEMVNFLLSEKSKWMTGQIIPFDGGISSLKTNKWEESKKKIYQQKNASYVVLNSHGEKSGRKIGMRLNTVANYAEAKDK